MIDIQRQKRQSKSIPLVSLIDVIFQLLIYFMLTTSFVRTESLELSLPQAVKAGSKVISIKGKEKTLHIYISDIGETFLESKTMNEQEMMEELKKIFVASPDRGVLVLSSSKVTVQVMVRVMDRIYTSGGRNIAVADWIIPNAPTSSPTVLPKVEELKPNG